MKNIQHEKLNFQQFTSQNTEKWNDLKETSFKFSDHSNLYFFNLEQEYKEATPERKEEIHKIQKASYKQQTCCQVVETLIHSDQDEGWKKKVLEAKRCTNRKTCRICASIEGNKRIEILSRYFIHETNQQKLKFNKEDYPHLKDYEIERIEKSPVLAIPITISPENYQDIKTGSKAIDKILEKIWKAIDRIGKNETKPHHQALKQLRTGHLASYWSKEIEPTKAGDYNCHWHGIIFMQNKGTYKDTLNYESMRELLNWATNGKCSNQLGDTRNNNKPIEFTEDERYKKAFTEICKYITKMPIKDDPAINEISFDKRIETLWDMYSATHRHNFIRSKGNLINFKPEETHDISIPEEIKLQSLTRGQNQYNSEIKDIDPKYKKIGWNILIKQERKELELFNLQNLMLEEKNRRNYEKVEKMKIREKGLETTIEKCKEKLIICRYLKDPEGKQWDDDIQLQKLMIKEQKENHIKHENEKKEDLIIEYQDKKIRKPPKSRKKRSWNMQFEIPGYEECINCYDSYLKEDLKDGKCDNCLSDYYEL